MLKTLINILSMCVIYVSGVVLGYTWYSAPPTQFARNAPIELTEFERNQKWIVRQTTPRVMILEIMAKEKFNALGNVVRADAAGYGTKAFTKLYGRPCHIVIPEGWDYVVLPALGRASWSSPDNERTLAHEIAHCLIGDWHRELDQKRGLD